MMDVHSKETRSFNMSRIKGKNTKPEILVRKYLFSQGLRYRLYSKKLPGRPDIVLQKYHTVIFIHGCFWHGHEGCRYFVVPKTRTEWWLNKINTNRENDRKNCELLKEMKWNVITVWECSLKKKKQESTLNNILNMIKCQKDNA
ncbi:DNA mismatch endonuclease Vsr [Bacteroides fragilis]|nr:DNA mismatch endonuclease Vsr [Bacteroides fragilis]MCE8754661.1 DNA mismatch endonuclease Vsr [Bacteroides fragilis]MCE8763165.1 DNA mismatch endonuclease Vsr [Bacteroides fragilis]MCE8847154.1 DNA mismatch endonuclease Vsr [Bacteroides fragilis]MCE8869647.1 DNA mismatch endonuclease Vsr [Bacteroides fragilis]